MSNSLDFHELCSAVARSDPRVSTFDKSMYFRYCGILCSDSDAVERLTNAFLQNTSLRDLTLDGGILSVSQMEAILQSKPSLQHLSLRWCHEASLLETAAKNCPALQTVDLVFQRQVDLQGFLAHCGAEQISIRTCASLTGITTGLSYNASLRKFRLHGRMADSTVMEITQAASKLTHLALRIHTVSQVTALAELLRTTHRLQELDLTGSNLRQGEAIFWQGLAENQTLQTLIVNQCSLSLTDLDVPTLQQHWRKNRVLRRVEVASNFLSATAFATLFAVLPNSVQQVNLELNLIDSESCIMLVNALSTTGSRWTHLQLDSVVIDTLSTATALGAALSEHSYLQEFGLKRVWISDLTPDETKAAWQAILNGAVTNKSIRKLALEGIGDSPSTVRDFLRLVASKANLDTLILRDARFDASECNAALAYLVQYGQLRSLDLGRNNGIDDSTVRAVGTALRYNTRLRELKMFQCASVQNWTALWDTLLVNQSLHKLDISIINPNEDVGEELFKQICNYLPRWKGLQDLTFQGPGGFTPRDASAFVQILQRNFSLRRISLQLSFADERVVQWWLDMNGAGRRQWLQSSAVRPAQLAVAAKDASTLFYCLKTTIGKWSGPVPAKSCLTASPRVTLQNMKAIIATAKMA